MPPSDPVIVARGLTKHFGAREAVRGIDLDVPRGGCFGFLGPNGAGKTTTLRMILGQSPLTAGTLPCSACPCPPASARSARAQAWCPRVTTRIRISRWWKTCACTRGTSA